MRLGATRAFEELGARLYLGSFYETGASSELGITPASMDLDKVGLSAGWHQVIGAGVSLDFAIAHQEWLTLEVTNGEARLIDPLTAEELHPNQQWHIYQSSDALPRSAYLANVLILIRHLNAAETHLVEGAVTPLNIARLHRLTINNGLVAS